MPARALYYPHTTIWNPGYLFDSLLYWDTISCIVPSTDFRETFDHYDPEMKSAMNKALEQFTHKLVPSDKQKRAAHEMVKSTLLGNRNQETAYSGRVTFYTMKLDPLTLELLLIGGWLKDTGVNVLEIEKYIDKRRNGYTTSYPPNYNFELPTGVGNLLMAALAAACSSEDMPPVTSDYYGFREAMNGLLCYAGATDSQKLELEYQQQSPDINSFSPKFAESIRSEDLRCLFATIPRLGYESPYRLPPQMLHNLILARGKDDVQERQKSFRDVVDKYLVQLRDADQSERAIIISEFKEKATRDLNLLSKELKRLALGNLLLKEGIVGMAAGAGVGIIPGISQPITAAVGSILGLASGLLKYKDQREKILGSHWASWAVSADNSRFSLW
jgi:hypothetical protein